MNIDKKRDYQANIIQFLFNNPKTSFIEISKYIGISEKTIRKYTGEINDVLVEQNLGEIEKKRGIGIRLKADGLQRKGIREVFLCKNHQIYPDKFDNIEIQKRLLLLHYGEYITKSKLAEELYESKTTLSVSIDNLKIWFKQFNIAVISQPSKGLTLTGDEFSRRQAIKSLIISQKGPALKDLLNQFAPGVDIEKIIKIIKTAEDEWKIQFTKNSFTVITVMISICVARTKYSIDTMKNILNRTEFYNEYNFADTIFQMLEKEGFKYQCNDLHLLALEIITANKIKWNHSPNVTINTINNQTAFDEDLRCFVMSLVNSISSILNVHLQSDNQLIDGLIQHLRSAIFRMKYGRYERNSNDTEIKSKYKKVYLSVLAMSPLFEEHYGIQITETELNYIVLYIEASLLRKQQNLETVLITNLGRAQRMLTIEMVKHYIPQISTIHVISQDTFESKVPSLNYQMLLSTESLDNMDNVIFIHSIPSDVDLNRIKERINLDGFSDVNKKNFSKDSQSLFDVNLIDVKVKVDKKDKLLEEMVEKMVQAGKVNPKFLDSVLSRESVTTTSIGNMVALPHGDMNLVNEPCVSVATLSKPIKWFEDDDEKVQVVIILAAKMSSKFDIARTKHFFQDLITFTENSNLQNKMIEMKDKTEIYNLLFN